ncbi:SDR family NAD(P)-dependent oxidoreductase [Nitratifractor sp.]
MANILVVGASSGIGRATAVRLASEHRVFAMARRADRLGELEAEGIVPVPFDVRDLEAIVPTLKTLAKEHGPFASLVYCAGVQSIKPIRMLKVDETEELYRVNAVAPLFFAKAFASRSVHDPDTLPSLTFVSSIAAQRAEKGIVAYGATKAALDQTVRGLAKELAPIRVNAVVPGFLRTEMTERFAHVYDEAFIERIRSEYPLGLGEVEDVAELIAFLIGPKARYLTGEVIRIDGGGAL